MKIALFILTMLVAGAFVSCDYRDTKMHYVCNCRQMDEIQEFMTKNIGAANNMSDEEMEDVIAQLHKTAIMIHCERRAIEGLYDGNNHALREVYTKLDSCEQVAL